jgi:hypothetical protein
VKKLLPDCIFDVAGNSRARPKRSPWLPLRAGSGTGLRLAAWLAAALLGWLPIAVFGHGSVAAEDDRCIISINFMEAHFTVFQPENTGNEEYCENVPDVTRSVFIMEYLHDLLSEMRIDFRIVRDINGVGRYASWEDIEAIDDLQAATVHYEPPRVEDGGFYQTSYSFNERGSYIGVVTAEHPTEDRQYNAVFWFRVGGRPWGTLPLFIGLLAVLQLGYWFSSGGYRRWSEKRAKRQQETLRV